MAKIFLMAITLLLIANSFQQTPQILAFRDSSTSKLGVLKEFNKTLSNFNWYYQLNNTNVFEFKDPDSSSDGFIRIKDFVVNIKSINISNTTTSIGTNGITVSGNKEINVTYDFNYYAKTGGINPISGTGYIQITSNSFKFNKKQVKPDDGIHSLIWSFSIDLDLIANLTTNADKICLNYLMSLIANNRDSIKKNISENLQNEIFKYYDLKSKSKLPEIILKTFMQENNKYKINNNFSSNPSYTEEGIVYYLTGNPTKVSSIKSSPSKFLDMSPEFTINATKGSFQLKLNYEILRPIIEDISNSTNFYFNLRDDNLPASIIYYKLSVEYLGYIIPAIYKDRPRGEKVIITANILDITINNNNALEGTCNVIFNIISEDDIKTLFKWSSIFEYELTPYNDLGKLHFNIELKAITLIDSTVLINKYGQVNLSILEEWITNSINEYINNENSFDFFKKPIDLSLYFSSIINFENKDNNLEIGGESAEISQLNEKI